MIVVLSSDQRWSRGHKARGQEHQKNPRPRLRTALPRTDPLEAKDRNARGQGPRSVEVTSIGVTSIEVNDLFNQHFPWLIFLSILCVKTGEVGGEILNCY